MVKRVFNFKKGQIWDGDEEIFCFIEEQLVDKWGNRNEHNFGRIGQDIKATVILERKPTKHNSQKNQSAFDRLEGSIKTDKSVKDIMKEVRSNKAD